MDVYCDNPYPTELSNVSEKWIDSYPPSSHGPWLPEKQTRERHGHLIQARTSMPTNPYCKNYANQLTFQGTCNLSLLPLSPAHAHSWHQYCKNPPNSNHTTHPMPTVSKSSSPKHCEQSGIRPAIVQNLIAANEKRVSADGACVAAGAQPLSLQLLHLQPSMLRRKHLVRCSSAVSASPRRR